MRTLSTRTLDWSGEDGGGEITSAVSFTKEIAECLPCGDVGEILVIVSVGRGEFWVSYGCGAVENYRGGLGGIDDYGG